MTRERGLIQSGSEVRGWLEGRKTQFRVVVKPQPEADDTLLLLDGGAIAWGSFPSYIEGPDGFDMRLEYLAPYRPGDRVYVRETYLIESNFAVADEEVYPPPFNDGRPITRVDEDEYVGGYWEQAHYKATDPDPTLGWTWTEDGLPWRSPATMPKWASRLWLTVTEVRAERLQAISEEDAKAEGSDFHLWIVEGIANEDDHWTLEETTLHPCYRNGFVNRWDSLHQAHPWASNPWVWRVSCEVGQ